jgi:predicted nucleic acid-binding protein
LTVVLDATAIVAALALESEVDAYLASATRILAPDLALAEVLNVRWKYLRAKLVAPDLETILAFFDRISLAGSRELAVDADRLSVELDRPVYDCLYVALAERENARFVTADRRLARKLSKARIDVVTFDS